MLTREAWEESSESAPGVSLRCRKPLDGTFVADEGKAVFDNRLCIERRKKSGKYTRNFLLLLLLFQNKILILL